MWFIFLPLVLLLSILISHQITGYSQNLMVLGIIMVVFFSLALAKMMYDNSHERRGTSDAPNRNSYPEFFQNYYPLKA